MTDDAITDDALFRAFADLTLPAAAWTHRTHLRVAFLHAGRWPLDEAHVLLRVGIIRLNAAHGLVETPQRGYHETITRFWLRCIAELRASDEASGRALVDSSAFCAAHPEILDKEYPLRFYSRELLFSVAARARFVEPDGG